MGGAKGDAARQTDDSIKGKEKVDAPENGKAAPQLAQSQPQQQQSQQSQQSQQQKQVNGRDGKKQKKKERPREVVEAEEVREKDNIMRAHGDLQLDIDFSAPPQKKPKLSSPSVAPPVVLAVPVPSPPSSPSSQKRAAPPVKKTLSVLDYKRRRGLI